MQARIASKLGNDDTEWWWLDGPPRFRRPGGSLRGFAAALVAADRTVALGYREWRCVLLVERRPAPGEQGSCARIIRRYELGFWVSDRRVRPGDVLGPPGRFVEDAPLSSQGLSHDDQTNAREAVCRLLSAAATTLDGRADS
jgi:hypothetical protein